MEVIRDYAQTEVGFIHETWFIAELGDLITFIKGFPFKSSEYRNFGIRIIRVSDTTYDAIKEEDPIYVSERGSSKYANWRLRENDLIVSTVGSKPPMYDSMVGKVIIIDRTHKNSLLNQNAVLIRDRQHRDYFQVLLLNHLRTKKYLSHIESIYRGNANQASITLKELFQFRIPLPVSELEQRAIATALSDVDALLDSLDRIIAKKRDLKQATMQQLLTGQTRLPGFSGEWEVKPLGAVSEIIMGQSPSSLNYNSNGIGLPLIQGNADIDNRKTIKRTFTTQITKRGFKGDILMSVRAPVGEISRAMFDVCLGRGVCAIRFKNNNNFLYHSLIQRESIWAKHSTGSTFESVNSGAVKVLELKFPIDNLEQSAISEVLDAMDLELEALEQRRNKTICLKQGMMQELLTGRTRLV